MTLLDLGPQPGDGPDYHAERAFWLANQRTRTRTARGLILAQVSTERDRQDALWGGTPGIDRRDDATYTAVLTEEVGEVCKAWLERDMDNLREELVQTAAVAVAWIEEIDNGGALPRPDSSTP